MPNIILAGMGITFATTMCREAILRRYIKIVKPQYDYHPGLSQPAIPAIQSLEERLWNGTRRGAHTNDNLNAIGFYQKRGFDIVDINLGAIDRERETSKPEIPLVGQNGIPLHHEIDFSIDL